jgi:hypothetical protein
VEEGGVATPAKEEEEEVAETPEWSSVLHGGQGLAPAAPPAQGAGSLNSRNGRRTCTSWVKLVELVPQRSRRTMGMQEFLDRGSKSRQTTRG